MQLAGHNRSHGGARRPLHAAGPELRAYDHGVGTLSVDGETSDGYPASVVHRMTFPSKGGVAVVSSHLAEGRKEPRTEDYGPDLPMVRELDAGRLEQSGPSTMKVGRVPGKSFRHFVSWRPPRLRLRVVGPRGSRRQVGGARSHG